MGECGCEPTYKFYRIKKEILVVETWEYCDYCGAEARIDISILNKNKQKIFESEGFIFDKIENLGIWNEEKALIILPSAFKKYIIKQVEEALDNFYDEQLNIEDLKKLGKITELLYEYLPKTAGEFLTKKEVKG